MRHMCFAGNDPELRWVTCYNALTNAELRFESRAEMKLHGILLDKLESMAVPLNEERHPGEPISWGCVEPGELLAQESEYQLVKKFLNAYVRTCPPWASRNVERALVWIDELPEKRDDAP